MNPYTTPSTAPAEDRAAPGFKVIQPLTLRVRVVVLVMAIAMTSFMLAIWFHLIAVLRRAGINSTIGSLFIPLFPLITFAAPQLMIWWQALKLEKRLRYHPLVQTGTVLYGGSGGLSQFAIGLIFLTADAIVVEHRDNRVQIPYRDIAGISRHRRFGFLPVFAMRLQATSQGTLVLWVTRTKLWWKLIEELKAKSTGAEEG